MAATSGSDPVVDISGAKQSPLTAARIRAESVLGMINTSDGFTTREGGYWTRAAVEGARPLIGIRASVALGTLTLNAY